MDILRPRVSSNVIAFYHLTGRGTYFSGGNFTAENSGSRQIASDQRHDEKNNSLMALESIPEARIAGNKEVLAIKQTGE
jgi:hypothetical protein